MTVDFRDEIYPQIVAFLEDTADFVGVSNAESEIVYLNPAARKRLGVSDIEGMTTADIFPPEAFAQYTEVIRPQLLRTHEWSGKVLVNSTGGAPVRMYLSTVARVTSGGRVNGNVVYADELDDDDVLIRADVPALDVRTGVVERSEFDICMANVLRSAATDTSTSALVAVSIDLRETITAYGAEAGEELMRTAARRVAELARTTDVLGLVDNTTLGLLLRGLRNPSEARRFAWSVYESLVEMPIVITAGATPEIVRCGFAIAEPDGDIVDLVRGATHPVWQGESSAGSATQSGDHDDNATTMHAFRVAWTRSQVVAYARPVVELASDRLVGYEGRARWAHETEGMLGASSFIDMIAESALAKPVDLFVAVEVAVVLLLHKRANALRLYTPISERTLLDVRTEQHLSEISVVFHIPPGRIRLEVPREIVASSTAVLRDALQFLHDSGVTLALAGVDEPGDAAFAAEHGFDELHLKRSFSAAHSDSHVRRTLSEIAHHAHGHGLLVLAWGLGSLDQIPAVIDAGCDLGTGDLFGALVPADMLE